MERGDPLFQDPVQLLGGSIELGSTLPDFEDLLQDCSAMTPQVAGPIDACKTRLTVVGKLTLQEEHDERSSEFQKEVRCLKSSRDGLRVPLEEIVTNGGVDRELEDSTPEAGTANFQSTNGCGEHQTINTQAGRL